MNEITANCTSDKFDQNVNKNPNINYDVLDQIIQQAYKKHIPVKIVKFDKHKHKLNKWITQGILSSINFRDRLYKRLMETKNNITLYQTLKTNLSNYNKLLRTLIRTAKKSYYESCFSKFRDDIKKTWNTIKTILNKSQKKKDFPSSFLVNGTHITNKQIIVDKFNEYFTKVGSSLAENITVPLNKSFTDYLLSPNSHTFSFEKVSQEYVSKIIETLKPKSSSGIDGISNKLLKLIKNGILVPLTLIINQAIENGIFPDRLKIAKVIPLFKTNEDYLFENYRPISVLPSLSKILERVMHSQLVSYFSRFNLFYDKQYGFRSSHSTELAALEITNRIINSMDKKEVPLAIFLDLSKAFDTIDHNILLHKLCYYGVKDKSLKLITNYLFNRKQYIYMDNISSELLPIKTGVPQG